MAEPSTQRDCAEQSLSPCTCWSGVLQAQGKRRCSMDLLRGMSLLWRATPASHSKDPRERAGASSPMTLQTRHTFPCTVPKPAANPTVTVLSHPVLQGLIQEGQAVRGSPGQPRGRTQPLQTGLSLQPSPPPARSPASLPAPPLTVYPRWPFSPGSPGSPQGPCAKTGIESTNMSPHPAPC